MTRENGQQDQMSSLQATLERFIARTDEAFERMDKQVAVDRAEWRQQLAEFQNKQEEERRKEQKAWNKRWGDLANRLGTVVEDIVAPNIPRIGRQYFGLDSTPEDFSVRRKVMHKSIPGKNREFDTIAVYPEAIILNDTKETVRQVYLDDYVAFIEANEFFDYFPEYRGRKLIPIFSSLYLADAAVNYLSKHKIYAMAMGDETMQLLNFQRVSRG